MAEILRRGGNSALTDIALYIKTVGNRKCRYSFGRFIRPGVINVD